MSGTPRKVLIVDDEPLIVELIQITLEDAGYVVITAAEGEAALSAAASAKPDLISLDVNMPVISGIEVCKRLTANPETKSIPVIMVSAFTQDSDVRKGLDAGAKAYVSKPVDLAAYVETVKKVLENKP